MERALDLPVSVDLPAALAQEVTGYVEVEAGWQVVAPQGPPAPALALRAEPAVGPPCIVVVEGTPSAQQMRDGLLAGALDVLGWPDDRHRLLDVPPRLRAVDAGRPVQRAPRQVRIGGVAGGAGTSTMALAVGGVLAWSGHRTVVVGAEDLLDLCGLSGWSGPGAEELAALGAADVAAEVPRLARPVPGVDGLAALRGDGRNVQADGWPVDAVVTDVRIVERCEDVTWSGSGPHGWLLVGRPDGSLRRAWPAPSAVPVVLVGAGPLDGAGAQRLLGRPPAGWLPASARVARAGLAGRVPSGLPGSYVKALRALLARVRP